MNLYAAGDRAKETSLPPIVPFVQRANNLLHSEEDVLTGIVFLRGKKETSIRYARMRSWRERRVVMG